MIDYIKYKWEIWKLDREESKLFAPYKKDFRAALKAGDEHAHMIYEPIDIDLMHLNAEKDEVHSSYLKKLAWKLDIPCPHPPAKGTGWWTIVRINGPYVLTQKGKHELRKEIDTALARRRQPIYSLFSLVTGLVAALTGLAAVLMK
ncbi:hypothetical protein [Salidesulfovibrio brasiliensis]|uniref:hypothetical protein n=1 Tax=Salidesulfovibrio brasiliensis TaxID=221711 RepID=UPI0006D2AE5A|nr:hypothetical protein [Salidesulfovibrio brasiliensis]